MRFPYLITLGDVFLKPRATTLLYIITNIFLIAFRTLQITVMTVSETAFLDKRFSAVSVICTVIEVLLLAVLFLNASGTRRIPNEIIFKGLDSAFVCGISGLLLIEGGAVSLLDQSEKSGSGVLFLLSIAAALVCFLYAASALTGKRVPKAAPIVLLALWLGELISSYLFYMTRALRARTVYETFATAALILFFLFFGKVCGGVKAEKNMHIVYPLGLTASTLCFVSVIPEFLSGIFGDSAKISISCVPELSLLGAGIFAAFVSIRCCKPAKRTLYVPSANTFSEEEAKPEHEAFDDNIATLQADTKGSSTADSVTDDTDGLNYYFPD